MEWGLARLQEAKSLSDRVEYLDEFPAERLSEVIGASRKDVSEETVDCS